MATHFNVMAVTMPASPKHPPTAFNVSGESTIFKLGRKLRRKSRRKLKWKK